MSANLKKIAVLTSGGDSPGMNAAIRAVVRTAYFYNVEVIGIRQGYTGMVENDFMPLSNLDVSNIIQRGGTILKSSRCASFHTKEGRQKAYINIREQGVDGLIAIGGDGTFTGANIFCKEFNIPIIGIPGTIDNDLYGTDSTIGYDTALNTALNAIDQIRDTANSHNRVFFVEVMGRDVGFIALRSGIAGGAESVLVPETKSDMPALFAKLEKKWQRHKSSMIVVVAEGDESGGAFKVAEAVKARFEHYDTKVSILGHMQRGGKPSCYDRVLASRLGVAAVEAILAGEKSLMVGIVHKDVQYTPFEKAIKHHKEINKNLLYLVDVLSS